MPVKYDVSLVLPCFNEGEHFNESVERIIDVLERSDFSWEIIFIDDCSKDNTVNLIKKFVVKNPRKNLSAFFHHKNQGRGATVAEGIERSQGRVVGYIDIDLEVAPDYIPQFVVAVDGGSEVVVGWRIYDFNRRSLVRWFASKGYNEVRDRILGTDIKDTEAGYKFFLRKAILPVIKKCRSPGWFWDTEIMIMADRAGLTIRQIPVVFMRRFEKTSTVKLIPDTIEYLKELWRFRRKLKKS